jgi:hypothetical protein
MKNIQLSNYCRWNDGASVTKFLAENRDLDMNYENGIYFKFAFKHNNNGILDILLPYYYNQHSLDKPIEDYNLEQKKSKQILLQILEECIETYDLSKEMTEVLKKYSIDLSNDDSDVDELEESFENSIIVFEQEHNSLSTTHHNSPEHYSPEENEYSKILYDIINPPAIKINDAEVRFMGQDSSDYNKPDVSIFENQEL